MQFAPPLGIPPEQLSIPERNLLVGNFHDPALAPTIADRVEALLRATQPKNLTLFVELITTELSATARTEHYQKLSLALKEGEVRFRFEYEPGRKLSSHIDHSSEMIDRSIRLISNMCRERKVHLEIVPVDYSKDDTAIIDLDSRYQAAVLEFTRLANTERRLLPCNDKSAMRRILCSTLDRECEAKIAYNAARHALVVNQLRELGFPSRDPETASAVLVGSHHLDLRHAFESSYALAVLTTEESGRFPPTARGINYTVADFTKLPDTARRNDLAVVHRIVTHTLYDYVERANDFFTTANAHHTSAGMLSLLVDNLVLRLAPDEVAQLMEQYSTVPPDSPGSMLFSHLTKISGDWLDGNVCEIYENSQVPLLLEAAYRKIGCVLSNNEGSMRLDR